MKGLNTKNKKQNMDDQHSSANGIRDEQNLSVQKTYKLYIGGKFPRTESGRYYKLFNPKGQWIANICRASRKDFRNAVVAARKAQSAWAGRSAYNRGQILYRIAEMLQWRSNQFVQELKSLGSSTTQAKKEVAQSIDRIIHYAGWADKYQQIFSAVNPVASSHFNFSVPEPMGVVSVFAPQEAGLLGLTSIIMPIIVGANSCVLLASEEKPTPAISFAEVLHTSDLPGGVVNILTGISDELLSHFATHMDVNAMVYCGEDATQIEKIKNLATENLKRAIIYSDIEWQKPEGESPYFIKDTQEIKTTWHPVEQSHRSGGSY